MKKTAAEDSEFSDVIGQIREAREEVRASLLKLAQLSDDLRGRLRRAPVEERSLVNGTTLWSNAHTRFATSVVLGLRRTTHMDRYLDRIFEEAAEERRTRETLVARPSKAVARRELLPSLDGSSLDIDSEIFSN